MHVHTNLIGQLAKKKRNRHKITVCLRTGFIHHLLGGYPKGGFIIDENNHNIERSAADTSVARNRNTIFSTRYYMKAE